MNVRRLSTFWGVLVCALGLARMASAATVDNFVPTSGTVGTTVTIVGSGFTGVTNVLFGSQLAASYTFIDDNTVTAVVPASAGRGTISVNAPSGTGTSTADFLPIPSISAFTPAGGIAGRTINLTVANLSQIQAGGIKFNGVSAAFSSVGGSYTSYTAIVPAGATTGKISATTPGGTGMTATDFIVGPAIQSFTPSGGPGATVTIDGLNFQNTSAVRFNGVDAASFTVDASGLTITAMVPAGASTGPITVVTPVGGTGQSGTDFTFIPPGPTVTSFSPTLGPNDTLVTITGTNFTPTSVVYWTMDQAGVSTTYINSTTLRSRVPLGALSGPIRVLANGQSGSSTTNFQVAPYLVSFSPSLGAVGTSVVLTGRNFTGATAVTFGGVAATFSVAGDTQINTTVPAGALIGPIRVTAAGGTGVSNGSFRAGPVITSFTPTAGPWNTSVTITGLNFDLASSVTFNGTAGTVTSSTPSQIVARVTSGTTTGPVRVITPGGTGVSGSDFVVYLPPTITSFTPPSGGVGATVTINGSNLAGATSVRFGTTAATFTVVSPTQLSATVPPGAVSAAIQVTTPGGSTTSSTAFQVGPSITSFTPSTGGPGTAVTINGTNFNGVTAVRFGGTPATAFAMVSGTVVSANVPVGAQSGPISVVASGGTATSAASFTVPGAPTITSFTPTSGPVGTQVTVTGTGFSGATTVRFGTIDASIFSVVSNTAITANVPAQTFGGPISVVGPGGTAVSSGSFTVTTVMIDAGVAADGAVAGDGGGGVVDGAVGPGDDAAVAGPDGGVGPGSDGGAPAVDSGMSGGNGGGCSVGAGGGGGPGAGGLGGVLLLVGLLGLGWLVRRRRAC
ncbi:MAG: IPT/TIG domain-containing protein [Deltaproteobacteria bacterium]|nr:IPT/TIG domain-containing protein [Deltaproteobacteria bacterium]